MIPHDLLFKQLLTTYLAEFLEQFVPELWAILEPGSLELVEQETPPAGGGVHMLRGDVLARARLRGQDVLFLVHVEHDAYRRGSFYIVFRYFVAYRERHGCPVYPVVLLSYARPRTPRQGVYTEGFPGLEVLRFQFQVVQLNRLDWRDFLETENPVAAVLMTRMAIAKADRPRVKAACLRNLVRLRLPEEQLRLLAEFPETYLRLDPEEERVFQGEIQGMEPEERAMIMQTSNQWILKGLEQGRVGESHRLLARTLATRFVKVPEELAARFHTVTAPDRLDRLFDAALTCPSLEAFEEVLARETGVN